MTRKRMILGFVAILAGLTTFVMATGDIHFEGRNCGTAIISTDPTKYEIDTGDPGERDLIEQRAIANCGNLRSARRLLTLIPISVAIAATVAGRKLREDSPNNRSELVR